MPAELPRLALAEWPTPLQQAAGLGQRIGSRRLFLKREDLCSLGLGGNKPRQLEVLLAEACAAGANTIITTAGKQSNFCRATAAAAAALGLKCVLLLRGDGSAPLEGNLLLARLFGAEIHWVDTDDPYADIVQDRLDELTQAVCRHGGAPWQIRLPTTSGPLAAAAAMSLAVEIFQQCPEPPRYIVLAGGSGLTAAGILAGIAELAVDATVLVLSVQQTAEFIRPLILKRAAEALSLVESTASINDRQLIVDDRFIGSGYGLTDDASLNTLCVAGRYGALVLDPAYTAKAFRGLIAYLNEQRIAADDCTVFVHTGGAPGLFAHGPAVARQLGG